MELPVEASPGKEMVLVLQLTFIAAQNDSGFGEIGIGKTGDGVLQNFGLQQSANGEQLFYIGG